MKCKNCNEALDATWKVCPACTQPVEQIKTCTDCKKELKDHWQICPFCQTPVANQTDLQDSDYQQNDNFSSEETNNEKLDLIMDIFKKINEIAEPEGFYFSPNTMVDEQLSIAEKEINDFLDFEPDNEEAQEYKKFITDAIKKRPLAKIIIEAFETDAALSGIIGYQVETGWMVDIIGEKGWMVKIFDEDEDTAFTAFVPNSQTGYPDPDDFEKYEGRELLFKVLKIQIEDDAVLPVLSHKPFVEEHQSIQKKSNKKRVQDYENYLIGSFNEGKARFVVKKDGDFRFGFVDERENILIEPVYAYAENFRSNLAIFEPVVGDSSPNYWGMVDPKGKAVIPPIHLYLNPFYENLIGALRNDGKAGYYDIYGNESIPFIYDEVRPFFEGLSLVEQDGKWGCIDKYGNVVIKLIYDRMDYFEGGFAIIKKNGIYGFVDRYGKETLLDNYYLCSKFRNGAAIVSDEEENYGLIDIHGNEIMPCREKFMQYAGEGLIWVCDDDEGRFIDTKGNLAIPQTFEVDEWEIQGFKEGLAAVLKYGVWGYINRKGQNIIAFGYDALTFFSEGLSFFEKGDEKGFLDKSGRHVINLDKNVGTYSHGWSKMRKSLNNHFVDGLAYITNESNRNSGFLDKNGNILWL